MIFRKNNVPATEVNCVNNSSILITVLGVLLYKNKPFVIASLVLLNTGYQERNQLKCF